MSDEESPSCCPTGSTGAGATGGGEIAGFVQSILPVRSVLFEALQWPQQNKAGIFGMSRIFSGLVKVSFRVFFENDLSLSLSDSRFSVHDLAVPMSSPC